MPVSTMTNTSAPPPAHFESPADGPMRLARGPPFYLPTPWVQLGIARKDDAAVQAIYWDTAFGRNYLAAPNHVDAPMETLRNHLLQSVPFRTIDFMALS